jgi:hypothetical protein
MIYDWEETYTDKSSFITEILDNVIYRKKTLKRTVTSGGVQKAQCKFNYWKYLQNKLRPSIGHISYL